MRAGIHLARKRYAPGIPRGAPHTIVVKRAFVTRPASHGLVVRPTAALRRNPGDVAVGVLHVAGFAVDAILGVDLESRTGGLLDPLIDAGRAIAIRRTGKDVMFGHLL